MLKRKNTYTREEVCNMICWFILQDTSPDCLRLAVQNQILRLLDISVQDKDWKERLDSFVKTYYEGYKWNA